MSRQTSPLGVIIAFLMGIGFFSIFYWIVIKSIAKRALGKTINPICSLAASFFLLLHSFFFELTEPEVIGNDLLRSFGLSQKF